MRHLNLRPLIALVIAASFGLAAFAQTAPRGFDPANMCTTTCKACEDFYQYANGGWIAKNEIPPAFSTWGITSPLREKNIATLHEILEDAAKNTAAERQQRTKDWRLLCQLHGRSQDRSGGRHPPREGNCHHQ